MTENNKKLSTEAYKGVRDFYPRDMFIQNYIFGKMRKIAENFGYSEYEASVLEPADLYKAKSGDEIVNEQTYTFKDRGEREVTLRPEMTPTLARMIAAKRKELSFPIRWFSIPNLFRYEQPQRGRVREHWQLNIDLFGIKNIYAEIEMISIASSLMREFGIKDSQFEIRINSRKIMNYLLNDVFNLSEDEAYKLSKLIDRKAKMPKEEFNKKVEEIIGGQSNSFITVLNSQNFEEFLTHLPDSAQAMEGISEVKNLLDKLDQLGIANAVFDQTLMRGFDYYTGIVFEVFDKNPENRRAVFGGGRYDDLLSIFGSEKVPAVGFGMGDVVIRDILESYDLLPQYKSETKIYICAMDESCIDYANEIAQKFRESGVNSAVDYSGKKVGDQIKYADKNGIPFIVCIGTEEIKNGNFSIKRLSDGSEKLFSDREEEIENLASYIKTGITKIEKEIMKKNNA